MMRRLRLTTPAGDRVTGRLVTPAAAGPLGIVLAHGAGAGQDHPWMTAMRDALAAGGVTVLTFNYPYTEAGRKAPDRLERLLATHLAAAERIRVYVDGLVLAGKSMGGRIGSHLAAGGTVTVAGLVYFGYPLVPLGRGQPRDTEHLDRIAAPQLFCAGTRDRLSPLELVRPLVARLPQASLVVVEGGDHSFHVPQGVGRSQQEVLVELAAQTVAWIGGLGR